VKSGAFKVAVARAVRSSKVIGGMVAIAAMLVASPVFAGGPLKIIVGFAAGSGIDVITRVVAQRVQAASGMTVIVENRPGAGGRVAAALVAHSKPGSGMILSAPIVTTAFTPFVYTHLDFDPLKDLEPITRLGNFKFTLALNEAVPANTVREFVRYAKAHPGKINYGTPAHFLGVMFNRATGTDLVHVPYSGSGPAAVAVLSGQVQSAFNTTVAMLPMYKAHKVKLLAVTGARRAPTLPDVPTFAELKMNLGDMEHAEMWYGFFAPGHTDAATIQTLNKALVAALNDPTVKARLQTLDIEVAPDTPDAFSKLVHADYERWGKVIRSTGFVIQ
jgi:tripartite-type tricarboxylate transporter receptor subunit TctC